MNNRRETNQAGPSRQPSNNQPIVSQVQNGAEFAYAAPQQQNRQQQPQLKKLVHKSIVFGTHAQHISRRNLGAGAEKIDSNHTHKWCCYVRGVAGEDISNFVSCIEFQLDKDSFSEPIKNITLPPFEIHQTGWGEFDLGIKVHFKDKTMEPVQHYKHLYLFDQNQPNSKKPRVHEDYNELVFVEPSSGLLEMLSKTNQVNENGLSENQVPTPEQEQIATEPIPMEKLQSTISSKATAVNPVIVNNRQVDRQSLNKGFDDDAFTKEEEKDAIDIEQAIQFIKQKVEEKRQELEGLELDIKDKRREVKSCHQEVLTLGHDRQQ